MGGLVRWAMEPAFSGRRVAICCMLLCSAQGGAHRGGAARLRRAPRPAVRLAACARAPLEEQLAQLKARGEWARCEALVAEALDGAPAGRGPPSTYACNLALGALAAAGQSARAAAVARRMAAAGVPPSDATFGSLVRACELARDAPGARLHAARMRSAGLPLNRAAATCAVRACVVGGDLPSALELLGQYARDARPANRLPDPGRAQPPSAAGGGAAPLDPRPWNAALSACASTAEADALLAHMRAEGALHDECARPHSRAGAPGSKPPPRTA